MPHTASWDEAIPANSDPAASLGLYLRNLRRDIRERMDDIVQDWAADPVELKAAGGATTLLFGPEIFMPFKPSDVNSYYGDTALGTGSPTSAGGVLLDDNSGHQGSLIIPQGATIAQDGVEMLIHNSDASSVDVTLELYTRLFQTSPAPTLINRHTDTEAIPNGYNIYQIGPDAGSLEIQNMMVTISVFVESGKADLIQLLGVRVTLE